MIALNLSEPFVSLNERVWRQVMLPALSQVFRDRPERLTAVLYRGRRATSRVFSVGSGVLAMVGGSIVHLLYDDRYAAAGWMLQIFALRIFARSIAEPLEQCASAIREPRLVTLAHAARTAWVLVGIPVAWHLWGLVGLVGAAATADLPNIIVFWIALGRRRILRVAGELSPCLLGAAGVALGAAIAAILNLLPPHFRLR
jgi:O-antigen/teichoic acid export membrane protein